MSSVRLLEKRRELYETEDAFEAVRTELAAEEEACVKREEDLLKRDRHLQEQIVRFNRFLSDNESKRKRAEAKAEEERKAIEEKSAEIAQLRLSMDALLSKKQAAEAQVAANACYEKLMDEAVVLSKSNNADILNRFKILIDTETNLLERQRVLESETDRLQLKSVETLLPYQNIIANLESTLQEAEIKKEINLKAIDVKITEKATELQSAGESISAIESLLNRVISQRPVLQHGKLFESHGIFSQRASTVNDKIETLCNYANDIAALVDFCKKERKDKKIHSAPNDTALPIPQFFQPQPKTKIVKAANSLGGSSSGSR